MSKLSQIHAELTEQANELGFLNIDDAEDNGYKVVFDKNSAKLVPEK